MWNLAEGTALKRKQHININTRSYTFNSQINNSSVVEYINLDPKGYHIIIKEDEGNEI